MWELDRHIGSLAAKKGQQSCPFDDHNARFAKRRQDAGRANFE
jgi:hypothetical protein